MSNLKGKKILYIGPIFYNYHFQIVNELNKRGASVTFTPERSYKLFYLIIGKLFPQFYYLLNNRRLKRVIGQLDKKDFDIVFVIRGEGFDSEIISFFRKEFSKAKFIYYNWDSVLENPTGIIIAPLFDKAFSFDHADCDKYQIFNYRPTFVSELYNAENNRTPGATLYDLLFIGTDHNDRYKILENLREQAETAGLTANFLLLVSKIGLLNRIILKHRKRKFYITNPLNDNEVLFLIENSKAVIDIHNPLQSGLTLRTYEILSQSKKLITTNESIRFESFYNENNILIINRKSPSISLDFIEKPFEKVSMNKYSLKEWVNDIFYEN